MTVHQVHGRDAAVVDRPWAHKDAPKADALVTNRRGIAFGILTADCAPILFVDAEAKVIGACHAGWRVRSPGFPTLRSRPWWRWARRRPASTRSSAPALPERSYEVGP